MSVRLLAFLALSLAAAHAASPERSCLPHDYAGWTASKKAEYLWQNRILTTAYPALPPIKSSLLDLRKSFLSVAFDHTSDEMPEGRRKLIHGFGTVARVMFRHEPSAYSGIFQPNSIFSGGSHGLLRASVAMAPSDRSFIPGIALKVFRDGGPSASLFAMNNLSGQTSWNFFEKTFSNIIPEPDSLALMLVAKAFARVKERPNELSLADAAARDDQNQPSYGIPVKAPAQIWFVPRPEVSRRTSRHEDFRTQLGRLEPGTVLYDVMAADALDGDATTTGKIGEIALASRFVASQWGDEKLFFQHPR